MQIAASVYKLDIGNIAYPQLIGTRRNESLDEVLPLVVAVVGVRRGAALTRLLHQSMTAQQVHKLVAPKHPSRIEHHREHQPEFHAADARINLTYLTYCIKNTDLASILKSEVGKDVDEALNHIGNFGIADIYIAKDFSIINDNRSSFLACYQRDARTSSSSKKSSKRSLLRCIVFSMGQPNTPESNISGFGRADKEQARPLFMGVFTR